MSDLTVDPAVGLPSGRPVAGSVRDGVRLPYSLDLKGRPAAHLVLVFDGTTMADVASSAASGTLVVPANAAGLVLSDHVQVTLTATDPASGAPLARASTVIGVSDGAKLPAALATSGADGTALAPGATLFAAAGQRIGFQTEIGSGTDAIKVTDWDLTVDGTSILDDAKPAAGTARASKQWVSGTWTAPTASGTHTLVLSGTVEGTSAPQTQTYTLAVQPTGTLTFDNLASDVDLDAGTTLTGAFKRTADLAPVANATLHLSFLPDGATAWTPVADTRTGADGRFSVPVKPTGSGKYQIASSGVPGTVAPTTSGTVAVGVRPHVTLSVDRTSAAPGTTLTFTMAAPAQMQGVRGMVQLWNGMTWCTVAWKPLDQTGKATATYVVQAPGSYKFGALTGYATGFAATASQDLLVTVR